MGKKFSGNPDQFPFCDGCVPTTQEYTCEYCKEPFQKEVIGNFTLESPTCDECQANGPSEQETDVEHCVYCLGEDDQCNLCWGTGEKNGKHPSPGGRYGDHYTWGSKWGIYNNYDEQNHLLKEIKQAKDNEAAFKEIKKTQDIAEDGLKKAAAQYYPANGPCVADKGNTDPSIRERYIVKNTYGQHVYIVKTVGDTGNGAYFVTEGKKHEKHGENTVGEFKNGDHWYSVYWRCQKSSHGDCSHDKSETAPLSY